MSGCFPTEENIRANCTCQCHREEWNGTECCKCHSHKFYHKLKLNHYTDIESLEYKNYQLLLDNIDILKNEIRKLTSTFMDEHARQIDENRKLSRRIEELEVWTKIRTHY